MRRFPDSSILIPFFRGPGYQHVITELVRSKRLWLSAVVILEVLSGARDQHDRRRYTRFFEPTLRLGQIVTPNEQEWRTCGLLLSRFQRRYGAIAPRDHQNDVLILLSALRSAREEETTILTENDAHFATWLTFLGDRSGLRIEAMRQR